MKWPLLVLLAGCDRLFLDDHTLDPNTPFSTPVPLFASDDDEDRPTLTGDLLEIYFHRTNRLFVAKRADKDDVFGTPELIFELDVAGAEDVRACVSGDGLHIYFSHGPNANHDIYFSERANRNQPWGEPAPVPEFSTVREEQCGWESADRRTMFGMIAVLTGVQNPLTQNDVWLATRSDPSAQYTIAMRDDISMRTASEGPPWANFDASIIVFDRRGLGEPVQLFQGTRQGDVYALRELVELDVPNADEGSPWLSPDGRVIVFAVGTGPASGDIYMATR